MLKNFDFKKLPNKQREKKKSVCIFTHIVNIKIVYSTKDKLHPLNLINELIASLIGYYFLLINLSTIYPSIFRSNVLKITLEKFNSKIK